MTVKDGGADLPAGALADANRIELKSVPIGSAASRGEPAIERSRPIGRFVRVAWHAGQALAAHDGIELSGYAAFTVLLSVELMGGRIWVESVIGKGSVLSFAAPFETPAGPLWRVGVPVGTAPERPLLPLRILLAEDSPDNRTITLAYWRARRSRLKSPRPEPSPVECLKQDTTISF